VATFLRFGAGKVMSYEAMQVLAKHDWPGNVRELRNVSGARDDPGGAGTGDSGGTHSFVAYGFTVIWNLCGARMFMCCMSRVWQSSCN
jgi:hypothetical protein